VKKKNTKRQKVKSAAEERERAESRREMRDREKIPLPRSSDNFAERKEEKKKKSRRERGGREKN